MPEKITTPGFLGRICLTNIAKKSLKFNQISGPLFVINFMNLIIYFQTLTQTIQDFQATTF